MLASYGKIMVTGGLGFIGSHLVRALLSGGKDVTILDNARVNARCKPPAGTTLVTADIRGPDQLADAFNSVELVFHVAGNSSGTRSIIEPRFDFETNAVGTFNLASAAASAGVRRFVYVSSASVYGVPRRFPIVEEHPTRPFVPYGASKLAAEVTCLAMFQANGMPVVVGRPFCVYGPGENPRVALVEVGRYLRWHLNNQPIQIVGDAQAKTRDFVHVNDMVAGLLLIAERAPASEVFNIGSGLEASMREVVSIISEVTGQAAATTELSHITQDTYRLVADISKLRALGFTPHTSLHDGIADLARQLGHNPELPKTPTIFTTDQRAEQ